MKMHHLPMNEYMRETTKHGSSGFPIQYYFNELLHFSDKSIPLHWHPELEFSVVRSGCVHAQIGETTLCLEEGFGIFVNANVLHSFQPVSEDQKCQCSNILFSAEFIAPSGSLIHHKYVQPVLMNFQLSYIILSPYQSWQKEILSHLDCIFSLMQKYGPYSIYGEFPILEYEHSNITSPCYELAVQNKLNQIWQLLFSIKEEDIMSPSSKTEDLFQTRTQKMITYIHDNYSTPLSLAEISSAAGISKSEASRCFQTYLHTSPGNYLLLYRIEKAKSALKNSSKSIEQISRECGFRSFSHFCNTFRVQTGMTANQYRNT